MAEFKEGDVVQLKSGGPSMTLKEYAPQTDRWECVWFHDKKLQWDFFKESNLRRVPEAGTGIAIA